MVQERMNSKSDLFKNFCGMYDPDDEPSNQQNLKQNCDQNDGDDASVDINSNSISNDASEHVCHVEAEVLHRLQIIATHRVANWHVYDCAIQHEQLQIALLPQTT